MMESEKNQTREKGQVFPEKEGALSKSQVIGYSMILIGAIAIMILSMIGINFIIFVIIIGGVILYIYLDNELEVVEPPETSSSEIKKD